MRAKSSTHALLGKAIGSEHSENPLLILNIEVCIESVVIGVCPIFILAKREKKDLGNKVLFRKKWGSSRLADWPFGFE